MIDTVGELYPEYSDEVDLAWLLDFFRRLHV